LSISSLRAVRVVVEVLAIPAAAVVLVASAQAQACQ
jgi:hypothetical protein